MIAIKPILLQIQKNLEKVSGPTSLHEAETILQFVLNCSRSELYTSAAISEISGEILASIERITVRRRAGEPLTYILGSVYFYSKEIALTRDVLIPRPETEVLVETVLKHEQNGKLFFADIGTGSGAIAAVLCAERPSWTAIATDISFAALCVARRNVPEARFVRCDMLSALKTAGRFGFLVCNPPYISQQEMAGLDTSVSSFEPGTALYGGVDGMDYYRVLASAARRILKPGGRIYCEIGCDQGASVCNMFLCEKWNSVTIHNDLTGRPRIVTAFS
jgi:release factor glutamine methyltransferase